MRQGDYLPKYLVVIERGKRNLSAYAPDVPGAVATGRNLEEVRGHMAEALAVQLEGETYPEPRVHTRETADTHARRELGQGLMPDDAVAFVTPAPMNPVSLLVAEAVEGSSLTQKQVAERMGTTQSAVSRLADPFYFGHSLGSLRRLAEVLGVELEISFGTQHASINTHIPAR